MSVTEIKQQQQKVMAYEIPPEGSKVYKDCKNYGESGICSESGADA